MNKYLLILSFIYIFTPFYAEAQNIKIGKTDYKMIFVEGSEFWIDNEMYYLPDFCIGQTEVTLGLWHDVMDKPKPEQYQGDNYPLSGVSLDEIDAFIARLNKLTNQKYRLPSGIEWQYAFQEGKFFKETDFSGFSDADSAGWYFENSEGIIQPVARKYPNSLGLYDMSGNVSEMCNGGFIVNSEQFWFTMGGNVFQDKEDFAQVNSNINKGIFEGILPIDFKMIPNGLRLVCDADTLHTFFPATYLTVSENEIFVPSYGDTRRIFVSTDAKMWGASYFPDWCKATKSEGELMLELTFAPNDGVERKDWFRINAGNRELIVYLRQAAKPATYLNVETLQVLFDSMDKPKNIDIDTDGGKWEIMDLPKWCSAKKLGQSIELTCSDNKDTVRNARIKVAAYPHEIFIDITQSGSATYLEADATKLFFPARGGAKKINIETDGDVWEVSAPWWCRVEKDGNSFTISCNENKRQQNKDLIKIVSGDKTVEILAIQQPPLNSPKGNECTMGFSAGYVSKQWEYTRSNHVKNYGVWDEYNHVNGFQFGFRFEPLFKYGFGVNTGLFFEYYSSKSETKPAYNDETFKYHSTFSEASFYIPLHLEYRLHFSQEVSLFFYGGISADIGLAAKIEEYEQGTDEPYFTEKKVYGNADFDFYSKRFNASYDVGGGIRIYNAQLNVGFNKGLINFSPSDDLVIKQNKNFMISLSWMIGKNDW